MKNLFIISMFLLGLLSACKKEDDLNKPILGLEGDSWEKGPLDNWIYENFTKPYNISVSYRWDGSEVGMSYTLVPTREDKVIPIMEVVKDAWINVYIEEVGAEFIKKLAPRQYMLVGSPQYNSSGTITVGQAEAGSKIVLFRSNWFEKEDRAIVKRVLKTIHHEFGHILHQNVMFPAEYELITPGDYTSSWNNISNTDANNAGFITPYAMSNVNDDFVELLAVMLTEGEAGYEAILNSITDPNGVELLKQKESILATYMKQVWDVDIYSLQKRTEDAINVISPLPVPPALHTLIGPGGEFSSLLMNIDELSNLSPNFLTAYNSAVANMNAYGGRYIEYSTFRFVSPTLTELTVRYKNPANPSSYYNAIYNFETSMNEAGDVSFSNWTAENGNGTTVATRLTPLFEYLTSNNFNFSWLGGERAPAGNQYGAFYELSHPDLYFYGLLQ